MVCLGRPYPFKFYLVCSWILCWMLSWILILYNVVPIIRQGWKLIAFTPWNHTELNPEWNFTPVINPIHVRPFRSCSRTGATRPPPKNLSQISYSNDTRRYYTLPKEDPKNIYITWHTPWILLITAFFYKKLTTFVITRNTDIHCILRHTY